MNKSPDAAAPLVTIGVSEDLERAIERVLKYQDEQRGKPFDVEAWARRLAADVADLTD